MARRLVLLVVLTCLFAHSLGPACAAQPVPPATEALSSPTDSGPVAVPEPSARAMQFYRTGNGWWVVATLWGLAVPLGLLFSGASARLRDWAQRLGKRRYFTIALYFVLFSLVTFLIDLPLSYYLGFERPHAYELSNQTAAKFWADTFLGLGISTLIGALLLPIPYALLRWSPRRWWLWVGLVVVPPLMIVGLLVAPVWISPLFNDFGPMKDQALEAQILALADRAGIEGSRVYEVAKSVDTKTINAYVTGFGATKRIVLWDTLLARLEPHETLFVMGHEMGHYVLGHVRQGILLGILGVLAGLFVIHLVAGRLIERFGPRFGFHELSDVASLPLLAVLFALFGLLAAPVSNAFSRYAEHESDRFALELTRDNHAGATAFVKLQQQNLANPRPGWLYKLWRSTHPPLGERVDFANEYRPWERGEAGRYEGTFGQSP